MSRIPRCNECRAFAEGRVDNTDYCTLHGMLTARRDGGAFLRYQDASGPQQPSSLPCAVCREPAVAKVAVGDAKYAFCESCLERFRAEARRHQQEQERPPPKVRTEDPVTGEWVDCPLIPNKQKARSR